MKKCLIVFFSLHGSTEKVAQSIAAGLRTAGYQVDLFNIKDKNAQPPDPNTYDLFGIGSPTLYCRPPVPITDYLNSLPLLNGLPAFVFVTYGDNIGLTGNSIRKTMNSKRAKEVGYFKCFGEEMMLPALKFGYLFSPGHPTSEELAQAKTFGGEVAACAAGKPYTKPKNEPVSMIFRVAAAAANPWMVKNFLSRTFKVDKKKCPGINLCKNPCTKLCPRENITADKKGFPVWGRNCMHCLTCALKCPENAIKSFNSEPSPPLWPYFIGLALKDPAVDQVKIEYGKGGEFKRIS